MVRSADLNAYPRSRQRPDASIRLASGASPNSASTARRCHPLFTHPHVHALASRGGWDRRGRWVPVPFVGPTAVERLFRHRVLALLSAEGLLSQERIKLLLSWRHSGFSAHNAVTAAAGDRAGIERLGRYLLRSPVAVERLSFEQGAHQVLYR